GDHAVTPESIPRGLDEASVSGASDCAKHHDANAAYRLSTFENLHGHGFAGRGYFGAAGYRCIASPEDLRSPASLPDHRFESGLDRPGRARVGSMDSVPSRRRRAHPSAWSPGMSAARTKANATDTKRVTTPTACAHPESATTSKAQPASKHVIASH